MSIPWDGVGSALGVAGGAAWLWFIKMRTAAKLKDLKEVNVRLKDGEVFKGKCVDMVKVGARNYLKFDYRENNETCERLVPNDEIVDLRATRPTPISPRKRAGVAYRASMTLKSEQATRARRIAALLPGRRWRSE